MSGIQNITIIMAAPFMIVMVVMCMALMKDLRNDPLVQRGQRCTVAIEQAVEFGTKTYGEGFYVPVKPGAVQATSNGSAASVLRPADEEGFGPVRSQDGLGNTVV